MDMIPTRDTTCLTGSLMPDYQEVLRDLRARKRLLEEQIRDIDKLIRTLERVSPTLTVQPSLFPDSNTAHEEIVISHRERGELPPTEIAKLARQVLLESGQPMKRGELVRALEARGIPLLGKDKNKNLGTIMWRHGDMFVSIEKLGYWPKDVPLEGVYEPE